MFLVSFQISCLRGKMLAIYHDTSTGMIKIKRAKSFVVFIRFLILFYVIMVDECSNNFPGLLHCLCQLMKCWGQCLCLVLVSLSYPCVPASRASVVNVSADTKCRTG